MQKLSLALLTLLALSTSACDNGGTASTPGEKSAKTAAATPGVDVGEVIADVGGVPVGSEEFEQAAARKKPAEGDSLSMVEKKEILDRLVDEKLLYKAALAKGLDRDPKVQKVMVNTLLRQEVYANVRNSDFTDEELQAYYEAQKDEFVVPEKVQIKRILIKINKERVEGDALALAKEVHGKLKADPSKFKDLAAKHSEDPYRRRGGDVGFVPRSGKPGLAQAVVDKAFEMNVEQLSAPFVTDEGVNIVYIANKREEVSRTFQQMKGSVLRKVKNEKLKELYEQYVSSLRDGVDVKIDEAKLGEIEVKASRRSLSGAKMGAGADGPTELMPGAAPASAPKDAPGADE
jgi:peptidyl-prolyl cis-trans isomerase C